MHTNSQPSIAICVATFKRPELLKDCIHAIGNIRLPSNYTVILIIVDNDETKTGKTVAENEQERLSIPLYYYVQPDRGISSTRNTLIEKSIDHNVSYIAFIDDDELPHKDWLIEMLEGLQKYSADIVAGPVVPIRENTPLQDYVLDEKHPSGTVPRNIPAGNVLFNIKLANEYGLRFDRYFDFIGCEDFDFFDRAIKLNLKSVWINNAVVFEHITPDRETLKYIIFRHFTGGINVVMRHKKHHKTFTTWMRYLPKSIGKFFGAFFSLIKAIFSSRQENLKKSIIKAANGLGYLFGLCNMVIERYRY